MQRWTVARDKDGNPSNGWQNDPLAQSAAEAIRSGDLVGVPTETVYGLGADATNGEACARIYQAKGRPQFNPLISHLESTERAREHGIFDDRAEKLAEAFWPGPLTLVLPKQPGSPISDLATAGLDSVALRVPAGPYMRFLTETSGRPIAAPSANLSGKISPTTADDVAADLAPELAVLIDGGPCRIGVESTIVSLLEEAPRLLRPGGLPRDAIESVLGCRLQAPVLAKPDAPEAPGMLTSHYAPNAMVRLNATTVHPGEALLSFGSQSIDMVHMAVSEINLSPSGDLTEAAARLFTALRMLDRCGADRICVQSIPTSGLGEAINDRLNRAAAPRI